MQLQKLELAALPYHNWASKDLSDKQFETIVEDLNLSNHSSWLLPQLVAHLGTWRMHASGKTSVLENCTNTFQRAMYRLSRVRRSILVKTQTKQPQYGQFVPLLLLGQLNSRGTPYSYWQGYSGVEWLLEPALHQALLVDKVPNISVDRLLAIRQQGLTIRTGTKAGQQRLASATWKLTGISDTELGGLDPLLQTMLCQCWLAHPQHRNKNMILDPNDWDLMPQPLITNDVMLAQEIQPEPDKKPVKPTATVPWDD